MFFESFFGSPKPRPDTCSLHTPWFFTHSSPEHCWIGFRLTNCSIDYCITVFTCLAISSNYPPAIHLPLPATHCHSPHCLHLGFVSMNPPFITVCVCVVPPSVHNTASVLWLRALTLRKTVLILKLRQIQIYHRAICQSFCIKMNQKSRCSVTVHHAYQTS